VTVSPCPVPLVGWRHPPGAPHASRCRVAAALNPLPSPSRRALCSHRRATRRCRCSARQSPVYSATLPLASSSRRAMPFAWVPGANYQGSPTGAGVHPATFLHCFHAGPSWRRTPFIGQAQRRLAPLPLQELWAKCHHRSSQAPCHRRSLPHLTPVWATTSAASQSQSFIQVIADAAGAWQPSNASTVPSRRPPLVVSELPEPCSPVSCYPFPPTDLSVDGISLVLLVFVVLCKMVRRTVFVVTCMVVRRTTS
jgi:hypothetical protein